MVLVDDAGNASPNLGGWAAFDEALSDRLVGPNVSASVAVMIDGQLVHAAAYGDRVAGGDDPVEPTDRYRIASISKTITAIVTMQLVEDGVLTLDDPVGPMLVDHLGLSSYDPDVDSITVRELLSHTAGFPKHQNTFFGNGATSCVDAAGKGLAGNVGGGGYRYSNMSYCVLGVLIEATTGKTYERVVQERLLTPLGINGMRMPSTYDLGPDEASHHPGPGRNAMETLGGAGSWNATPSDLVRILNSIDHSTPGWKAVSVDTATAMRYRRRHRRAAGGLRPRLDQLRRRLRAHRHDQQRPRDVPPPVRRHHLGRSPSRVDTRARARTCAASCAEPSPRHSPAADPDCRFVQSASGISSTTAKLSSSWTSTLLPSDRRTSTS